MSGEKTTSYSIEDVSCGQEIVCVRMFPKPTTATTPDSPFRYDKLAREVREKEETLAKARLELDADLGVSGGASILPARTPTPPIRSASRSDELPKRSVSASAADPVSGDSEIVAGGGIRRDGPWVLESLGLRHQASSDACLSETALGGGIRMLAASCVRATARDKQTLAAEVTLLFG